MVRHRTQAGSRQANPDCEVQELSRCKLRTVYFEAPFDEANVSPEQTARTV